MGVRGSGGRKSPPDCAGPRAKSRRHFEAKPELGRIDPVTEPRRIAHYEIGELLGRGGMGEVYRAVDTRMYRRPVALKLISEALGSDPRALSRFDLEIETAANLQHPNIVTIYDRGEYEGRRFFVMELLEGVDLSAAIKERTTRTLEERLEIVRQLCEALDYAHRQGVVHRDIKPANIMLVRAGGADHVKLLDFGIAKVSRADRTRTVVQPGTLFYMSPEQLRDDVVDARSDLFAVGVVAYELCCGVHPFRAKTEYLVSSNIMLQKQPPARSHDPSLPEALDALLDKLMEKEREKRPASAGDVAAELRKLLGQLHGASADSEPHVYGKLDEMTTSMVERLVHWAKTKEAAGAYLEALEGFKRALLLAPEARWLEPPIARLEARLAEASPPEAPTSDDARSTSARDRHRETFVLESLAAATAAFDEGDVDRASSIIAGVMRRYPDEHRALELMDRIVLIAGRGIPVKPFRQALRAANAALAAGDVAAARRSCDAAVALWPDAEEAVTLGREIEKRRHVELAEALRLGQEAVRRAAGGRVPDERIVETLEGAHEPLARAEILGAPPEVLEELRGTIERLAREAESRVSEKRKLSEQADAARRAEVARLISDARRRIESAESAVTGELAAARAAHDELAGIAEPVGKALALDSANGEARELVATADALRKRLAAHIAREEEAAERREAERLAKQEEERLRREREEVERRESAARAEAARQANAERDRKEREEREEAERERERSTRLARSIEGARATLDEARARRRDFEVEADRVLPVLDRAAALIDEALDIEPKHAGGLKLRSEIATLRDEAAPLAAGAPRRRERAEIGKGVAEAKALAQGGRRREALSTFRTLESRSRRHPDWSELAEPMAPLVKRWEDEEAAGRSRLVKIAGGIGGAIAVVAVVAVVVLNRSPRKPPSQPAAPPPAPPAAEQAPAQPAAPETKQDVVPNPADKGTLAPETARVPEAEIRKLEEWRGAARIAPDATLENVRIALDAAETGAARAAATKKRYPADDRMGGLARDLDTAASDLRKRRDQQESGLGDDLAQAAVKLREGEQQLTAATTSGDLARSKASKEAATKLIAGVLREDPQNAAAKDALGRADDLSRRIAGWTPKQTKPPEPRTPDRGAQASASFDAALAQAKACSTSDEAGLSERVKKFQDAASIAAGPDKLTAERGRDDAGVRLVLYQLARLYATRDAKQIRSVWPSYQEPQGLKESRLFRLTFQGIDVDLDAKTAMVDQTIEQNLGKGKDIVSATRALYRFDRSGDGWVIAGSKIVR
jgi:serine/threonine protein kinase